MRALANTIRGVNVLRRIASRINHTIIMMSTLVAAAACADTKSTTSGLATTAVVVWPDTVTINVGDTLRLRALLRANRKLLAGNNITWTIDDSSVARVFGGLVTAGHVGSTTVTASAERARGSAHVEVVRQ